MIWDAALAADAGEPGAACWASTQQIATMAVVRVIKCQTLFILSSNGPTEEADVDLLTGDAMTWEHRGLSKNRNRNRLCVKPKSESSTQRIGFDILAWFSILPGQYFCVTKYSYQLVCILLLWGSFISFKASKWVLLRLFIGLKCIYQSGW